MIYFRREFWFSLLLGDEIKRESGENPELFPQL